MRGVRQAVPDGAAAETAPRDAFPTTAALRVRAVRCRLRGPPLHRVAHAGSRLLHGGVDLRGLRRRVQGQAGAAAPPARHPPARQERPLALSRLRQINARQVPHAAPHAHSHWRKTVRLRPLRVALCPVQSTEHAQDGQARRHAARVPSLPRRLQVQGGPQQAQGTVPLTRNY